MSLDQDTEERAGGGASRSIPARRIHPLVRVLGIAGAFLLSELLLILAGIGIVYRVYEYGHTVSVGDLIPEGFPLVVVTAGGAGGGHKATVVWHGDLADFLAAHPDHSFRIPEHEAATLWAQVESETRARGFSTSRLWFATFRVRTRSDGTQDLDVVGTNDDDRENRSWYEVRGESISAMRYLHYFGPGVAIATFLPVFLGATLLNVSLWYGARWLRRVPGTR